MSLTRIVAGRSATLSHTFESNGTATDPSPDSATVAITRADGSTLTPAAAVDNSGNGVASITLTPAETALLDTLTVTWTATIGGYAQTFVDTVEIAGDVLFTIGEARRVKPLDQARYTAEEIVAMRTTVEDAIEEWTGALVPRYTQETLSGTGGSALRLSKPFVRQIRQVTVDGVPLTSTQLAGLATDGTFLHGMYWTSGHRNITVGYEHGLDRPPERLRRAALLLAKTWLVAGPVDDRTSTFSSVEGGTFALVTPGRGGSIFGVPEVDAAVQAHTLPAVY